MSRTPRTSSIIYQIFLDSLRHRFLYIRKPLESEITDSFSFLFLEVEPFREFQTERSEIKAAQVHLNEIYFDRDNCHFLKLRTRVSS